MAVFKDRTLRSEVAGGIKAGDEVKIVEVLRTENSTREWGFAEGQPDLWGKTALGNFIYLPFTQEVKA
jgi:hypothetical protein